MKLNLFKNWEYWPSYMFYIPLLPYAFYLALKRGSFGFFSSVNPSLKESGNGLESKYETLQLVPKALQPKSFAVETNSPHSKIHEQISKHKIDFPLIVKPDIGFRGLLVKKINTPEDLIAYLKKYNSIRLIIQELITLPNECGIFYHKIPGEQKGQISSLTLKRFLSVRGNGKLTLKELIQNDQRAKRYLKILEDIHGEGLDEIPIVNKNVTLNLIGNHSKGTQFIDGNHLISSDLEKTFDELQEHIKGWYYGRIDIKYDRFEELIKGKNFKIIELNGIISEPTHIYDASKGSYIKALKSICQHWKIASIIGEKNKKLQKAYYTDFKFLVNLYFRHKAYAKKIRKLG
jgi:hypothetical protein